MTIDKDWVEKYIATNGNRVLIPKEASIIKNGAFPRNLEIELFFEEHSCLKIIESSAFSCRILNEFVIPRSVKEIQMFAFDGNKELLKMKLDTLTELEICYSGNFFSEDEVVIIPSKIKRIMLGNLKSKKIVLADCFLIEKLSVFNCKELEEIQINEKQSVKSTKQKRFLDLEMCQDKCVVQYVDENYNGICELRKRDTFELLKTGNILISSQDKYPVMIYDSIFDVDFNLLEEEDLVSLATDSRNCNGCFLLERKSQAYTKRELMDIKKKIDEIIKKINVPPVGVLNREKIIYVQIIKNLCRYLKYDSDSVVLLDEMYKAGIYSFGELEKDTKIDVTQNMLGLLCGKTVCSGFISIISCLAFYFKLKYRILGNSVHVWILMELDGECYEDDITNYINYLQTNCVAGAVSFLRGKTKDNIRVFDFFEYCETEEDLSLSDDLTSIQRLYLLTTDWSKIKDWSNVNQICDINDYLVCSMEKIEKLKKKRYFMRRK